jgi:hypothetical protein
MAYTEIRIQFILSTGQTIGWYYAYPYYLLDNIIELLRFVEGVMGVAFKSKTTIRAVKIERDYQ